MKRRGRLAGAALLALWAAFGVFVVWGAARAPFHPDESTVLYLSHDLDVLLEQGPGAVTWQATGQPADVMRYRLLDAPLTRYLVGSARRLAGRPALPRDWNWGASWDENERAGALPSAALLAVSRLPAALLTALSFGLVYAIGARLHGRTTGLLAAILYGLSGVALLHGRRGLAEGPLVFFSLAAIWLALREPRRTWLGGASAAMALAAKLTALAVLPAAGLAVLAAPRVTSGPGWRERAPSLAWLGAGFLAGAIVLSPALWRAPAAGLRAMAQARQELLAAQTSALGVATPGLVANGPVARVAGLLYQVYFAPLAFWEAPNYAAQTRAAEADYLANPLNSGWHTRSVANNLVIGGVMLGLTLAGLAFGALALLRPRQPASAPALAGKRHALLVMGAWSAATAAGLLTLNIVWQRYYLPLEPIVCLWAAYGAASLARPFTERLAARRAAERPASQL